MQAWLAQQQPPFALTTWQLSETRDNGKIILCKNDINCLSWYRSKRRIIHKKWSNYRAKFHYITWEKDWEYWPLHPRILSFPMESIYQQDQQVRIHQFPEELTNNPYIRSNHPMPQFSRKLIHITWGKKQALEAKIQFPWSSGNGLFQLHSPRNGRTELQNGNTLTYHLQQILQKGRSPQLQAQLLALVPCLAQIWGEEGTLT